MKIRKLGTSGIEASAVGLGTWAMGGWMWGGGDDDASIASIHAAIDAGVTLIDTAPVYGLGRSEEVVGKALQGRRDKVVLATKCGLVWHTDGGNHFFDQDSKPVHRYLGAASIRHEVEQSLCRLKTDYIDHYITHWQDPTTPISETAGTLSRLRDEGKIRSIGISNATPDDLNGYLASGTVDAIQECYNMLDRQIETSLLPICQDNDVACLSYSSLALGLLSGGVGPDRQFSGDDQRKDNPRFTADKRRVIADFLAAIAPIGEAHGLTAGQLVIAWTLAQPGITYSLCGARNAAQADENAKAGAANLSTGEIETINREISNWLGDFDAVAT